MKKICKMYLVGKEGVLLQRSNTPSTRAEEHEISVPEDIQESSYNSDEDLQSVMGKEGY